MKFMNTLVMITKTTDMTKMIMWGNQILWRMTIQIIM